VIEPVGLDPPASVAVSETEPPSDTPAEAAEETLVAIASTAIVSDPVIIGVFGLGASGSGVVDDTLTLFESAEFTAVGVTVIVTVAEPPLARLLELPPLPIRQLIVVVPEQVWPEAESVEETYVTPAGSVSANVAPAAVTPPVFLTTAV
jgi:hypothetical protein